MIQNIVKDLLGCKGQKLFPFFQINFLGDNHGFVLNIFVHGIIPIFNVFQCGLNRNSERIPRSLLQGSSIKQA
jgi:hypothetical protein